VDISQPVPFSFILETVGGIFVLIAMGIAAVKLAKKSKEA